MSESCIYCSAEDALIEDHRSGDVICEKCGIVQPEQLIDTRPVIEYDNDDHGERDRTHVEKVIDDFSLQGTSISATKFGSNVKSQEASKLSKFQKIAEGSSGKQEHHLKEAFAKIDELGETLQLPNGIKQTAKAIFRQYETTRRTTPKGLRKDSFLVAVLSVASKHEPGGRSIKQLAQAVNLEEKENKKFFKLLIKEPSIVKITSGRKSMISEVENLVDQFCNKLQLPFQIVKQSKEVAVAAAAFLEGKRQSSIAAASIQFVVTHIVRANQVKPQDIAKVASVSSNTLRNVYKDMKQHIDQLPQDLFQARVPSSKPI